MTKRDDFPAPVKRLLAERVGRLCSKPDCLRPTIGPRLGSEGIVSTGVAAHITAAAPGGPRFDKNLNPQERRSYGNGIWLCANHAHQVDHDKNHFTEDMLHDWKRMAVKFVVRKFDSHPCILQLPRGRGLAMQGNLRPVKTPVLTGNLIDSAHFPRQIELP